MSFTLPNTRNHVLASIAVLLALAVLFRVLHPLVYAASFPISGQALVENTGAYLDFDNSNSNVYINMTHEELSGYAYSEDLGWVAFGDDDNPSGAVTFDVDGDTGILSGRAFVLATGAYLDFDSYDSEVSINLSNGTLSGYAFSEDIGWINFGSPGVAIEGEFPLDTTEPVSNASNITMQSASDGHVILDEGWSNSHTPYFSWDSGSNEEGDPDLKGYCLYLGTETTEDPGNHLSQYGTSGLLINSPVETFGTDCQFIVAGTSLDLSVGDYLSSSLVNGQTYYLRIKAIDDAGNTYNEAQVDGSAAASFTFSFDGQEPNNVNYINPAAGTFNNIADMSFSWPTTPQPASSSDAHSGVLGWQYAIDNTTTWLGSEPHPTLGINYIPALFEQPYYLSEERDKEYMHIGNNIIYFRTVDNAGNFSPPSTYRTGSLAYGGDAPFFEGDPAVTVTPESNTSNEFALSWPEAKPAEGRSVDKYYYMINTTPPLTLAALTSNPGAYIPTSSTSVAAGMLPGAQKDSNFVRVVAVDDEGNYSQSNFIEGTFTLDSDIPDPAKNLTVSDASIKAASLWRASLAWDHPDYRGTGELTYTVQRSIDGSSWTTITTTSGTAFVDTVGDSRQYYWRVGTSDTTADSLANPSYTNAVTLTPKGSYTDPANLTSGPSAEKITTRKAEISWTTNRESDSKVAFGTKSGEYFDEEPSNFNQVTDHTINLTNLLPGTTYYFKARWTDEDGNTGESEEKSFSTVPAPTVTDPQATQIGISSAILRYTVNGASSVKIYYGKSTSFGGVMEVATSTQEVTLTTQLAELEDGSLYYYKINPVDSEGFEYEGQALTFETMPRPRITGVRLQEVAGSAQTTVLVSWTVNTPLSAIVSYYPTGQPERAQDKVDVELRPGTRQMVISGLLPQQQYQLIVKGRDRVGNEAVSDTYNFTTATDTRPPQIINLKVVGGTIPPVGFAAGDIKAQLVVTWDTDEPSTSQVEFGAGTSGSYSQKTQEDGNLTTNHSVIISGLSPSQVYHLRAIAKDGAGNQAQSIDIATIAPKATRSAFDLVIANLSAAFGFLGFLKQ